MNKDELIELLKTHKQTTAKKGLNLNEINKLKRDIEKIKSDYNTSIVSTYQEGSKSNKVSSKVESAVLKKDERIIEKEEIIKRLEEEIIDLDYELNQVNIRLGSLSRLEKEIITAYYIDEMDYDEIGNDVFYHIKHQTRSRDTIKRTISQIMHKLAKL